MSPEVGAGSPVAGKSTAVAYVLWFFVGVFGGHQFYLGKTWRGVGYLFTFAWLTIGLWIDLFTLPAQVKSVNVLRAPRP
jgi:TM2 domain-containing membrane protein YozV